MEDSGRGSLDATAQAAAALSEYGEGLMICETGVWELAMAALRQSYGLSELSWLSGNKALLAQ